MLEEADDDVGTVVHNEDVVVQDVIFDSPPLPPFQQHQQFVSLQVIEEVDKAWIRQVV